MQIHSHKFKTKEINPKIQKVKSKSRKNLIKNKINLSRGDENIFPCRKKECRKNLNNNERGINTFCVRSTTTTAIT